MIRSGGTLTHATLSHYDSVNSDALTYIASRCKRLEYLELRTGISNESLLKAAAMASGLKTLILLSGHEVSLDTVTQLLAQSKSLEHAEFYIRTRGHAAKWEGDLSKLRVLKLHAAKDSQGSLRLELVCPLVSAPSSIHTKPWSRTTCSLKLLIYTPSAFKRVPPRAPALHPTTRPLPRSAPYH